MAGVRQPSYHCHGDKSTPASATAVRSMSHMPFVAQFCRSSATLSVVDACTVNAFKARLDKFLQHQLVKFDFSADLTGTGNRSEEVIK